MATTDAKAGFRLPWSSDRQSSESLDGESPAQTAATSGWPTDGEASRAAAVATDAPEAVAAPDAPEAVTAPDVPKAVPAPDVPEAVTAPDVPKAVTAPDVPKAVDPLIARVAPDLAPESAAPAPKPPTAKKPSKFMADLTKAMQAAAEDARSRAISQLQADAKTHVESIHGRSATEAAELRRTADDDVAGVREWSKAEIARIREETETKITERKARLEMEIEQHAAVIEREIDAVQKTVAEFEEEMAAFFERLLGEEDPSRFATMAENVPDSPSFDGFPASTAADEGEPAEAAVETEDVPNAAVSTDTGLGAAPEAEGPVIEAQPSAVTEAVAATEEIDASPNGTSHLNGELDPESAFAAIQAAAEAAASDESATAVDEKEDPRFAALGLSPDFDAAETEAVADAEMSDEEIPEIGDDALAARIAGLVPGTAQVDETAASTQVIVVGLVSVASIASFKRHLGRLAGVRSVGVSSGPEGEFVFAVSHEADVVLRDAIPSLPSFQARVTTSTDGAVHVTAHDPESDA